MTEPKKSIPMKLRHAAIALAALLAIGATSALYFLSRGQSADTATIAAGMIASPCTPSQRCRTTWTFTSRLGQILEFYKEKIGARDPNFELLGIEFTTSNRPRIWFPDYGHGPKSIIVQLTQASVAQPKYALFALAHEAFHLIAPAPPGTPATRLEEGLATYFAFQYLVHIEQTPTVGLVREPAYRAAYEQVRALAQHHVDFDQRLRDLRQIAKSFSLVSSSQLRAAFPGLSQADADHLADRFVN